MQSLVTSIRLNNEDKDKLDQVAEALGLSRAEAIRHCILSTWMALNESSPETQKALRKLNQLKEMLDSLAAS